MQNKRVARKGKNGNNRQHNTKPLYEEELVEYGRSDSVVQDMQLIKGVLPDLFAVLKFLESDDNLVYKGTICHYFFKNYRLQKVNNMNGGNETVMPYKSQLMEDMPQLAI